MIGYDSLPDVVKRPLNEARDAVGQAIASGSVSITFADPFSTKPVTSPVDKGYYVSISGRNRFPGHNYTTRVHGYSSGKLRVDSIKLYYYLVVYFDL